jgi:hypothetical protein
MPKAQVLSSDEQRLFDEGFERVKRHLESLGLEFVQSTHVFIDPDEMSEGNPIFVADFKIKNKTYKEILDIWNKCSFVFSETMPMELRYKTSLSMED